MHYIACEDKTVQCSFFDNIFVIFRLVHIYSGETSAKLRKGERKILLKSSDTKSRYSISLPFSLVQTTLWRFPDWRRKVVAQAFLEGCSCLQQRLVACVKRFFFVSALNKINHKATYVVHVNSHVSP